MRNDSGGKTLIRVPPRPRVASIEKAFWKCWGAMWSPFYLARASMLGVPGLAFRRMGVELGIELLARRRAPIRFVTIFDLFFMPIDSTRYFEFDFAWRALSDVMCHDFLDVSSPRLFPILFARKYPRLSAHWINPDRTDLAETTSIVQALGLDSRCKLHDCLIGDAPFDPDSFDVITCISVMEHIPDDGLAIRKMWEWLKPKGRLVISVPCAARAFEQHIDRNEYGILPSDDQGFFFWQRFYDLDLIEERIFKVCGEPTQYTVYGEKKPGTFSENAERKRANSDTYAFWREPFLMARDYGFFDGIADLPGEGVVAMEFIKS